MDEYTQPKKKILNLSNAGLFIIITLAILFVSALGTTYYFYKKSLSFVVKDPQKEMEQTIQMIDGHMVLPLDENPTMATISDPEKLKDQPFFANAKKGDKVLIYASSQRAILYDPEADIIIEVAPINLATVAQAENASVVQTNATNK